MCALLLIPIHFFHQIEVGENTNHIEITNHTYLSKSTSQTFDNHIPIDRT